MKTAIQVKATTFGDKYTKKYLYANSYLIFFRFLTRTAIFDQLSDKARNSLIKNFYFKNVLEIE